MQKCFSQFGGKEGDLPATELACKEVLTLPIYPELHEDEVRYAAEQLREAAK